MKTYVELGENGFSQEEIVDIKRCLETLLSIRAGSQPLDRRLGINYEEVVGYPLDVAKNMITLEIMEKIQIYEPRVEIDNIDFDVGNDGQLKLYIHFIKKEG